MALPNPILSADFPTIVETAPHSIASITEPSPVTGGLELREARTSGGDDAVSGVFRSFSLPSSGTTRVEASFQGETFDDSDKHAFALFNQGNGKTVLLNKGGTDGGIKFTKFGTAGSGWDGHYKEIFTGISDETPAYFAVEVDADGTLRLYWSSDGGSTWSLEVATSVSDYLGSLTHIGFVAKDRDSGGADGALVIPRTIKIIENGTETFSRGLDTGGGGGDTGGGGGGEVTPNQARTTKAGLQTLYTASGVPARTTKVGLEVLSTTANVQGRSTRIGVQVLRSTAGAAIPQIMLISTGWDPDEGPIPAEVAAENPN